jgi:cytochrome bd-type quinol oxidase subunit 2
MRDRPLDRRTLALIIAATAIGAAWAAYNLSVVGAVRDDSAIRPLVWVVFAGPMAIFLGWTAARRREVGLAAACCFCLYFFSFFVAQRIESVLVSPEQVAASAHSFYFSTMIVLHSVAGVGLAIWRALAPLTPRPSPLVAEGSPTPPLSRG